MKYLAIFLFLLGMVKLNAQEAISASGGNISGGSGSVSYTVGQVGYTTNSGSAGSVMQGVQQPYEIFIVTALENIQGIDLTVELYPNPSAGFVKLITENFASAKLRYELYDLTGNLIMHKRIEGIETWIDMDHLPTSVYHLKIMDDQKAIKTFKIIKNQ